MTDAEKIRGTLRLIHQKTLLNHAAEAFLYIRNKKKLQNLELAAPFTRSPEELLQLKKDLGIKGVIFKGAVRFWWEMAVPENFLNLEEYLAVGIDGVILNLDELQKLLEGYEFAEGEFYKKQVKALVKFIKPTLKSLHQAKIPVIARGELTVHHEVLEFLLESGVWGIVANTPMEAENLPEHLSWVEKRLVLKKFN